MNKYVYLYSIVHWICLMIFSSILNKHFRYVWVSSQYLSYKMNEQDYLLSKVLSKKLRCTLTGGSLAKFTNREALGKEEMDELVSIKLPQAGSLCCQRREFLFGFHLRCQFFSLQLHCSTAPCWLCLSQKYPDSVTSSWQIFAFSM